MSSKKRRLTDLMIDRLKPPLSGRDEYDDTALSGLSLRVTSGGAKSWSLLYRHNGRFRRHALRP